MNEKVILKVRVGKAYLIVNIVLSTILLVIGLESWLGRKIPFGSVLFFIGFIRLLYIVLKYAFVRIIVTDKMVKIKHYDLVKNFELPIDSISAVAEKGLMIKSLSVSSASGRISFPVDRHIEVKNTISSLITERRTAQTSKGNEGFSDSNIHELEKYKELLDKGVITQEDFDAKKKQILRL